LICFHTFAVLNFIIIPVGGSVTSAFGDFNLTEFVADGESNPVAPLLASAEPS